MKALHKAITVKNPTATKIADGLQGGVLRRQQTKYRGDLLIISAKNPDVRGFYNGAILAKVDLQKVVPASKVTAETWKRVGVNPKKGDLRGYHLWVFTNTRRLIERPITGKSGLFNLSYPDDDLIELPNDPLLLPTKRRWVNWVKLVAIVLVSAGVFVLAWLFILLLNAWL